MKGMSIPCDWCQATSAQIDSLEYQIEELEKQIKFIQETSARKAELQFLKGFVAGKEIWKKLED